MRVRRVLLVATAAVAVVVGLGTEAFLHWVPVSAWSSPRPATCLASGCFCEAVRWGESVLQPVNSWSSLTFLVPAGIVLAGLPAPGHPARGWMGLFAVSLTVTAMGSAAYHAALTFDAQFLDVLGMYLTAGVMIFYAVARARKDRSWRRHAWLGYGAYVTVAAVALVVVPDLRRWLFGVLLILGITLEVAGPLRSRPRGDIRIFFAGVALFAAAFLIWWLDQSLLLCWPTSPLQGHAIWHLLGAAASGLLFVYYAREWSLHS